ncbi:bifunctional phosphopantothenoylcysteine decarboxylase/phosphopantothenate--cysteine ligase CoaBC [Sporohalobacter salinus]|uniref:bifunctional phosphopantothenoylcysteine decarboxylase/phosphopantothenate--cysteine ligase CoaBC n=1 Tax=Sporohalobacter salinus TaxID=1494606 RepID=UPI001EF81536|nr:bifunctional phosphopantothenoylcysteine decarboxylase/phosphopantothenate--cysteine ligase CoaBC [Sporohalobacter salinus]MBM7623297.1 phosphopantothenoylcysteine decarboxylase/phosphopantothenate--cysteine ligase [Sporohalobacter salinus]
MHKIKEELENKNILLGVTGGIAAYKALEVVSRLKKLGAEVDVIMTEAAKEFVQPLSFRSLSHNPVIVDMFSEPKQWNVKHISLAEKADICLVAPATANIVGKIANGIADDMLSTTVMATNAPVLLAPAMNCNMYSNPIFQQNLDRLRGLGYYLIKPDAGYLACGTEGKGRLPAPSRIVENVVEQLTKEKDLTGQQVMITAGGTQEPIDPVRFIGNHSSGKMGYAIAREAVKRGAEVTLITASTSLQPPSGIEIIQVETAQQMYESVMKLQVEQDVIIKAAAVADYRPQVVAEDKIKKDESELVIKLERNPDILAELGRVKEEKLLIGFAAESEDLIANAKDKLSRKNLDLIVANDITADDAGFGADTNRVVMISRTDKTELPTLSKEEVANRLLGRIIELLEGTGEKNGD